jgi:lauroyl/myristoyl acyltransferase
LVATIVSQEFKNPLLDPIFNQLREQSGHQFVRREGAIVKLYKTLRRGGTAAILVDLTLHPRQPSVAIDVLGMKVSVTFAHVWLHRRTGRPIVPVHQEPLPGGRCRVVFHPRLEIPSDASDQEIAQLCWDQFEPVVRQNPSPWLWMYKYWRFRPTNATRPYPYYAHSVPRFDKLLAQQSVR